MTMSSTSHTKSERGQAAVEMLAYAAFFFAVFVTAVAIFLQVQTQELTRAENAYAQEVAYGFADSIQTAFVAGPGFSQQVSIPRDLLGKPYKIVLSKGLAPASAETGFVYVEWQGASGSTSVSEPTITAAYQGTSTQDNFINATATDQITIDAQKSPGWQLCMRNIIVGGAEKIEINAVHPPGSC